MTTAKESPIQVYGIKNCSTVKKALDWLTENQKDFEFHDFKKEPASTKQLENWEKHVSWETLVNKRGTTWRKLDADVQARVQNATTANEVLLAHNSLIKRPVIVHDGGVLVGFDEEAYKTQL